jgi:transposase
LLETACEARGFRAIFLPKFHCELNFIEQCWGYSKRVYREMTESRKCRNRNGDSRDRLKKMWWMMLMPIMLSFMMLNDIAW